MSSVAPGSWKRVLWTVVSANHMNEHTHIRTYVGIELSGLLIHATRHGCGATNLNLALSLESRRRRWSDLPMLMRRPRSPLADRHQRRLGVAEIASEHRHGPGTTAIDRWHGGLGVYDMRRGAWSNTSTLGAATQVAGRRGMVSAAVLNSVLKRSNPLRSEIAQQPSQMGYFPSAPPRSCPRPGRSALLPARS